MKTSKNNPVKEDFTDLLNQMPKPKLEPPLQKTVPILAKDVEPEERLNVNLPSHIIRKLKVISATDDTKLKSLVLEAIMEKFSERFKGIE
ncbi:hypothetical protein [uncultured Chryseobacterium sp.]|uniref:hypothetical protein n=1 Tax=uncultured Chryseobacterium sp. TaxID=259322 RepID=UPI0025E24E9F|nr:hypothetical protein [uncultured Chryseobacterium sp.]